MRPQFTFDTYLLLVIQTLKELLTRFQNVSILIKYQLHQIYGNQCILDHVYVIKLVNKQCRRNKTPMVKKTLWYNNTNYIGRGLRFYRTHHSSYICYVTCSVLRKNYVCYTLKTCSLVWIIHNSGICTQIFYI